ncbi:MAG: hypothetical protein L0221_02955 [Chloroflexi bacterium]|nr:hypothetical protein [Chloroflexota bacterium]
MTSRPYSELELDRADDHILRVVLEGRLQDALATRRWYRGTGRALQLNWIDLERENAVRIRTLVAVLRSARHLARLPGDGMVDEVKDGKPTGRRVPPDPGAPAPKPPWFS